MEITRKQLETVNNKIINHNRWNFFGNCVAFMASVWNSVSKKKIVPLVLPVLSILNIALIGGRRIEMLTPERDEVFKQVGQGDSATLKPVSDKTVTRHVG